jgi:hypothetical protein
MGCQHNEHWWIFLIKDFESVKNFKFKFFQIHPPGGPQLNVQLKTPEAAATTIGESPGTGRGGDGEQTTNEKWRKLFAVAVHFFMDQINIHKIYVGKSVTFII